MLRNILVAAIFIFVSSVSHADLCGNFFTLASACNDERNCEVPVYFDRETVSLSGGWSMSDITKPIGFNWNFELKNDNAHIYIN